MVRLLVHPHLLELSLHQIQFSLQLHVLLLVDVHLGRVLLVHDLDFLQELLELATQDLRALAQELEEALEASLLILVLMDFVVIYIL